MYTYLLNVLLIPLEPADSSLDRVLGLRQRQLVLFRLLALEEGINVCEIFLCGQAVECVGDESGRRYVISMFPTRDSAVYLPAHGEVVPESLHEL